LESADINSLTHDISKVLLSLQIFRKLTITQIFMDVSCCKSYSNWRKIEKIWENFLRCTYV